MSLKYDAASCCPSSVYDVRRPLILVAAVYRSRLYTSKAGIENNGRWDDSVIAISTCGICVEFYKAARGLDLSVCDIMLKTGQFF